MDEDDDRGFEQLYDPDTLAALDRWEPSEADAEAREVPSRLGRWSRRTAMGMVLSGVALGLQEVFDPPEQHPIVIEVDDDGASPHLPVELFLDPDSPARSLCLVRRDLLPPPVA